MKNLLIKRILLSLLLGSVCSAGQQLKAMEEDKPLSGILLKLDGDLRRTLRPQQMGVSYNSDQILVRMSNNIVRIMEKTEATGELFDHLMFTMKEPELKQFYWKGYGYEEDGKYALAAEAYDQMFAPISSEEREGLLAWFITPKPVVKPVAKPVVERIKDTPTHRETEHMITYCLSECLRSIPIEQYMITHHFGARLSYIPEEKRIIHTVGPVRWLLSNLVVDNFLNRPIDFNRIEVYKDDTERNNGESVITRLFFRFYKVNSRKIVDNALCTATFTKLPIKDDV